MEVGENVKQKYLEQASVCNPDFLLRALDVTNQADVNYRNSNNKRLHVELMLLQIAASAGTPVATTASSHVSLVAPAEKPPATQSSHQTKPESPSSQAPKPAPPVNAPSATQSPGATKPERPLSIKINKPQQEEEKKNYNPDESATVADAGGESLSESKLDGTWEKLKENYRHSAVTLFTAMNKRKPGIQDDTTILVTVDNVIQRDAIIEKKPEILSFLRKNLNNYGIAIEIQIAENVQVSKAYLPAEKYQKMVEKNKNIEKLRNDLDLDLIY
jgi:DNA polymerase III subunit gamma/tau